MEFTLLLAAAFAAAGLGLFLRWEAKRGNAAGCSRNLWDVAVTAAVAGIFIGRIAAMVGDGVNPLTHPGDLMIVRAGVSTGPAALAAIGTVIALAGRELVAVADGLAAAALGALSGWHAGCLPRDACLGTPSDLPWAYSLGGGGATRHPVELYAAVALFAAAACLAWYKASRRPAPLLPAGVALAAAGAVRLATEPLRPSLSGGPEPWYAAAVVVGLALAGWGLRRRAATGQHGLGEASAGADQD